MDFAARGRDLSARAERLLTHWFRPFRDPEAAAVMYGRAAADFKLAAAWEEAVDAHVKQARVLADLGHGYEEAEVWTLAAKTALRARCRPGREGAVALFERAAAAHADAGRLCTAAKRLRDAAQVPGDCDDRVRLYERAAAMFEADHAGSEATKCRLEIARLVTDPLRAAEEYEAVAGAWADDGLRRYQARACFLDAGICRLCCVEAADVRTALDRYVDVDPAFEGSREHAFLVAVVDAADAGDEDEFVRLVAEYDALTRLEPHRASLLLRVKRAIAARRDDLT